MTEYYFDIETYSPGKYPNPQTDKIITFQFQEIDLRTGKPKGDLEIFKEWQSSEEHIVTEFYKRFFADGLKVWDFIPVGNRLNFEFRFLISKFDKYLGEKLTSNDLHSRPYIDLKTILVLLNGGNFKGSSLDKFSNKTQDGRVIKNYYENEQFNKIEEYIKNETESFLELLQKLISNIHKLV
jgi:hypothetical protein